GLLLSRASRLSSLAQRGSPMGWVSFSRAPLMWLEYPEGPPVAQPGGPQPGEPSVQPQVRRAGAPNQAVGGAEPGGRARRTRRAGAPNRGPDGDFRPEGRSVRAGRAVVRVGLHG